MKPKFSIWRTLSILDKLCVVFCAVMVIGNVGSFELGGIRFEELLAYVLCETLIGCFFALIGIKGVTERALFIFQEIHDAVRYLPPETVRKDKRVPKAEKMGKRAG